ncbi:MAG: hypothetical protein ACK47B_03780 [Armatimonadota bacterium]
MPRPYRFLLAAWGAALLLAAGAARAAGQAPDAPNGYPELLSAAKLLEESRWFREALQPGATLSQKRRAVADREVREALALLRRGLDRPVFPPEPRTEEAALGELSSLRSLGRLVMLQQYVLLADGRVQDALHTARLGLRLGHAVKAQSLTGGLVGIGISSGGIREMGKHLAQLSVSDCRLLSQICAEWLAKPDPLPGMLEAEWQKVRRNLAEQQKMAAAAAPDTAAQAQALFAGIEKEAEGVFQRLHAELRKPAWERKPLELPQGDSPGAAVAALLVPVVENAMEGFAREEAYVRLLAVHAAILSYRWEQNKLPAALAELNLGALALDPFSGQPFQYKTLNPRRYELLSAGPKAKADDPNAVNGRVPLSVVPE